MPVNVYTDYDGRRILVRHTGAPGIGIPPGGSSGQILVKTNNNSYQTMWANPPAGTNSVVGPNSAVDGNFALFDGVTGKLIKDSGRSLTYYASVSLVDTKQDKVTGKGLSTEDFTTALKIKLEGLASGGFRGVYPTEEDIDDIEGPIAGNYAFLEVDGQDMVLYLFDSTNELWFAFSTDPVAMTGQEIADVLYETVDAAAWDKENNQIFTSAYRGMVDAHETTLAAITGGTGFQPVDPTLTALAGLTNLADRLPYFTGVDAMGAATFTSVGRDLVGAADYAAQRAFLGLDVGNTPTFAGLNLKAPSGGVATLVAGTVTISNTSVTANTIPILSRKTIGGTAGNLTWVVTPGVSVQINSSSATDTSQIGYVLVQIIP